MRQLVIFDFDGTLTMGEKDPIDWGANPLTMKLLETMWDAGMEIQIWTHREEMYLSSIEKFLQENIGPHWITIKCRRTCHEESAVKTKQRFINELAKDEKVLCVYEDDDECIEMYRSNEILTFKVEY